MKVNVPNIPSGYRKTRGAAGLLLLCGLIPGEALACACGCSVFDVGSTSLLPKEGDHGGAVYFEWDHSDQNRNWSGTSKAPADSTADKRILTDWYVVGLNYMLNRDWGVAVRIPSANRAFTTDTSATSLLPDIQTFHASTLGDIEVTGMYTGFSNDMSKGLIFGVKLPTGDYTAREFRPRHPSRHGQHRSHPRRLFARHDHRRQRLAVFQPDKIRAADPTSATLNDRSQADYRPGASVDAAAGITYNNWYHVGPFDKVAPLLQVIVSHKGHDSEPSPRIPIIPATTGFSFLLASTSPK